MNAKLNNPQDSNLMSELMPVYRIIYAKWTVEAHDFGPGSIGAVTYRAWLMEAYRIMSQPVGDFQPPPVPYQGIA